MQEQAHRARRTTICCAPARPSQHLRFPRTAKHLLMKRKAARPSNNSVSACSSTNLQFANSSVEFGHRAACVWGFQSFMVHVCVERECCFTAVVGWPTPARHRQRSEPNHVARKMARNMRTQHGESRCVFGPARPHFSRPANHFRNAVTECRCESCVSACKVPSKSRTVRPQRPTQKTKRLSQLQYVSSIR